MRHEPPFHQRPWILEAEGRRERLGTPLRCHLCEQLGGEAACLLPNVCPDCGAVLDGGSHRAGCGAA